MKNEIYVIRDRYKKSNFKIPDDYTDIKNKELYDFRKKVRILLDKDYYYAYKHLYFEDLYKEYGSSVKILNHIENNVGIERFVEIMEYFSKDNIYSYDFIKYVRDNTLIIPNITEEVNKENIYVKENKMSVKSSIVLAFFDILFIVYWLYVIFINNVNHWIYYVSLTGFTISFIVCIITIYGSLKNKVVKTNNK